jgi:hypothetical protein
VTVTKNFVTAKKITLQSRVLSCILESVGGNDKVYDKSVLSRVQTMSLSLRIHATDLLVAKLQNPSVYLTNSINKRDKQSGSFILNVFLSQNTFEYIWNILTSHRTDRRA